MEMKANGVKAKIMMEVVGSIENTASKDLSDEIIEMIDNGVRKILISFENVSYIDSSGLGSFVFVLKKMREKNGEIGIYKMGDNIRRIFDMTRLDKFFKIFDNEIEAIEYFEL